MHNLASEAGFNRECYSCASVAAPEDRLSAFAVTTQGACSPARALNRPRGRRHRSRGVSARRWWPICCGPVG
eukprot:7691349-Alexandrium_andersonii.AAC.1